MKKFFGNKGFDNPEKKIPRKSQSMGSGFIYSSNGYIITNHHVIADADQIIVKLNDKRESVVDYNVPSELRKIELTLSGKILVGS